MFQSSNYVPKTSLVPQNCPNCMRGGKDGSGVCTDCGGNGGSGTTCKKNRFSDFLSTYGSGYIGVGKWAGHGGRGGSGKGHDGRDPSLGRLAEKAGSGAVNLLRDTGSGAVGLLKDTGSGAVGFAKDTGSGAVGFAKDTGSGAVGLLKDTGSGAVGLLKDTGSGVSGLLKSNPTSIEKRGSGDGSSGAGTGQGAGQGTGDLSQGQNPYQSGYFSKGSYSLPNNPLGLQGIDPYSYNGALVSKGGNYIPITNDFSAFRK